jgi:hypothetical protein
MHRVCLLVKHGHHLFEQTGHRVDFLQVDGLVQMRARADTIARGTTSGGGGYAEQVILVLADCCLALVQEAQKGSGFHRPPSPIHGLSGQEVRGFLQDIHGQNIHGFFLCLVPMPEKPPRAALPVTPATG